MFSIIKTTENGSGWLVATVDDYDEAVVLARLYAQGDITSKYLVKEQ